LNKEGPRLRGVYGRKAASVPDFGYSEGLRKTDIRWDDRSLDRWLSDPASMVTDTDMAFRLADEVERKAVIAHLKSLRCAALAASRRKTPFPRLSSEDVKKSSCRPRAYSTLIQKHLPSMWSRHLACVLGDSGAFFHILSRLQLLTICSGK